MPTDSGHQPKLPDIDFGPFSSPYGALEDEISFADLLDGRLLGEAYCGQDITLPEDAEFEIRLQDISLGNAPAITLASSKIIPAEQLPLSFKLSYFKNQIRPGHIYAISATIYCGDQLLYANDSEHLVFANTGQSQARLKLVAIT